MAVVQTYNASLTVTNEEIIVKTTLRSDTGELKHTDITAERAYNMKKRMDRRDILIKMAQALLDTGDDSSALDALVEEAKSVVDEMKDELPFL